MVTEGSEEGASNLLNSFADILISGDQSQWSQNVEYYRSQGYSDERAFEYALGDQALGLGLAVLGGMLSGGLLAGGYGGVNVASGRGDSRIARDDTAVGNVRPTSQSNMIQELTATAHTPLERRSLSQYKNAVELLESRQRVLSDTQNQIHLLESTGRTGSAEYNKLKSAELSLNRKVDDAQRKVDRLENGTSVKELRKKAENNSKLANTANNGTIKKSNEEVRRWYLAEVAKIKDNIDSTLPMDKQALSAFEARNSIRMQARLMMADEATRADLDRRRPNWSFEDLVKSKMERKGLTREQAVLDIYETATKTNEDVNKLFGLGGK